ETDEFATPFPCDARTERLSMNGRLGSNRRVAKAGRIFGPAAAVLLCASSASAQEWLKDRRFSDGQGWNAGDLQFQPSIAGEVGEDANGSLRPDKTGFVNSAPAAPVTDGGVIRITPSVTVNTLTGPRGGASPEGTGTPSVDFKGGLAASYYEFIGRQELRD